MKPTKFSTLLTALIAGVFILSLSSCSKDTTPTVPVVPSLTTTYATEITDTSAKISGEITRDGGGSITERGVCYDTLPDPTFSKHTVHSGSGSGAFECILTGLNQRTQYYYKTYAVNSAGIGYSDQRTVYISGPCPGLPTITDPRDSNVYNTVQIGSQCWMAENLNIGTRINGDQYQFNNSVIEKYCYDDLESNCDTYGGLYQWAEAVQYLNGATNSTIWSPVPTGYVQGICPEGWHIPSIYEWRDLRLFLSFGYLEAFSGSKMRSTGTIQEGNGLWLSPNYAANNESGFTAIPGGILEKNHIGILFKGISESAQFWSSLSIDTTPWYTIRTNCIWLRYSNDMADAFGQYKKYGLSVRCLKD